MVTLVLGLHLQLYQWWSQGNNCHIVKCSQFILIFVCTTKKSVPSDFHRGKCSAVQSNQKQLVEVQIRFARKTELFPLQKCFFIGQRYCMNTANIFTVKINKSVLVFIINPFFSCSLLTHLTPSILFVCNVSFMVLFW